MKVLITGGRKPNGQFAKVRVQAWNSETNWDDGWIDRKGKFHVYRPDYPRASATGWAFRAHVVWWLVTGQAVCHPFAIHHRNHVKLDDRFQNLKLMLGGEHIRLHCSKPPVPIQCRGCRETFYLPQWRVNQGKKFCSPFCYRAFPKSQKTRDRMAASQRLVYAEGRR
ncbi:hypothetical protein LCGC14_1378360 [marine sediment metagenome]|uniref:HNH nuclease domain-containing protein n=1 Tax=marine sediment metagenome TaxID=412755 RepID=A0A0F9K3E7_9ZZZZ